MSVGRGTPIEVSSVEHPLEDPNSSTVDCSTKATANNLQDENFFLWYRRLPPLRSSLLSKIAKNAINEIRNQAQSQSNQALFLSKTIAKPPTNTPAPFLYPSSRRSFNSSVLIASWGVLWLFGAPVIIIIITAESCWCCPPSFYKTLLCLQRLPLHSSLQPLLKPLLCLQCLPFLPSQSKPIHPSSWRPVLVKFLLM